MRTEGKYRHLLVLDREGKCRGNTPEDALGQHHHHLAPLQRPCGQRASSYGN